MIKYVTFDANDEYGRHVTPADQPLGLVKTASSQDYSPEVVQFLKAMKRDPNIYYAVINAMGTYEAWGYNKRGDAFPVAGLTHLSLPSDMGTENDYGFKTFEYYAKLYRHHVNKDPAKSFGPVLFSHFNPNIQRVELVTGIRYDNAKDLIDKVEKGEDFAVSMGCKVRYDRCSICGNKAKTRNEYCKHLSDYMKVIADDDLARRWSLELGHTVLPGAAVFAFNDHPRFFDISYVDAGADATAFLLGKAASSRSFYPSSAIEGEVSGVTDGDIDKLASIGKAGMIAKKSEIEKVVDNGVDTDTNAVPVSQQQAIKKLVKDKVTEVMLHERGIDPETLNTGVRRFGAGNLLQTMLGIGIQPRPIEVQRIVLVSHGMGDLADLMDQNNCCFDYTRPVEPRYLPGAIHDGAINELMNYIALRSVHPAMLMHRIAEYMGKTAGIQPGDYWFEQSPYSGSAILQSDGPHNDPRNMLSAAAAIYAGLKLQASGLPVGNSIEVFSKRPWMGTIVAGGTFRELLDRIRATGGLREILTPSYEAADLDNSMLFKTASNAEVSLMEDYVYNPAAYVSASYAIKPAGMIKSASLRVDPRNPMQCWLKQQLA